MDKKFSLSITIYENNGHHVYLALFSSLIPSEMPHENTNRAKSGDLTLRFDEFEAFVLQTKPHILRNHAAESLPESVQDLYTFQAERGNWDYDKWVLKD